MKLIRTDGSVVSSQDVENVFTWEDGRASWREWDYDGIEAFPYTVMGRWEPDPVQAVAMEPPPGSWADIARMMAAGDDSGFDWDAWKDEMKEGDL